MDGTGGAHNVNVFFPLVLLHLFLSYIATETRSSRWRTERYIVQRRLQKIMKGGRVASQPRSESRSLKSTLNRAMGISRGQTGLRNPFLPSKSYPEDP